MNVSDNMDLGGLIDLLYATRVKRLEAEKEIKALKTSEVAYRVRIKQMLDAASLEAGSGKLATTSVCYTTEPTAKDWPSIYSYIVENDAFDMLQRRLSATAVRDRWNEGIIIPGIDKFDSWDLSLTKRSK